MTWHIWLAFALTSAVMGLIPGPGVTSIVGYAVSSGRKTALASVAGMTVGNVIALTLSLAGVGALLAASTLAFTVIKWIGAIYLIGLGIVTVLKSRNAIQQFNTQAKVVTPRAAFAGNVAVATFHPKVIMFSVAFIPQFISAQGNYLLQAGILVATFCAVVAVTDTGYALAASRASQFLRRPKTAMWSGRAGGGILIAAGIATAAARK